MIPDLREMMCFVGVAPTKHPQILLTDESILEDAITLACSP